MNRPVPGEDAGVEVKLCHRERFAGKGPVPLFEGETRLSHHKKTADLLTEKIAALASEEKAIRSAKG